MLESIRPDEMGGEGEAWVVLEKTKGEERTTLLLLRRRGTAELSSSSLMQDRENGSEKLLSILRIQTRRCTSHCSAKISE